MNAPDTMPETTQPAAGDLAKLLDFIRDSRGFDASRYRLSTLTRRIDKRMHDVGVSDYTDYRDMLESSADEFGHLFDTILVNVTGFHRDPQAWRYLRDEIVPELLAARGPDGDLRVWSAGCSTGQESYSLAMVFAEALGLEGYTRRVKIYATDVDEKALAVARAGVYPEQALDSLPIELRERYFARAGTEFEIRPELRRRVVFGRHDITRDAPISHLDLLVCRNVLIYLSAATQAEVLDRFQFAVRAGGYLFLGRAESPRTDGRLFHAVSTRHHVYRRDAETPGPASGPLPMRPGTRADRRAEDKLRFSELALESAPFAALGVAADGTVAVVNNRMRAEFDVGRAEGRPLNELEIFVRPVDLRPLLERAIREHRGIAVTAESVTWEGASRFFDVVVEPLWAADGAALGALISFIDITDTTRVNREHESRGLELETAHQELLATNEELETTNEELQSSLEELETTNEELRSSNEALETTNEELRCGNEQLEIVNADMRAGTAELEQARTFLASVLESIDVAIAVLDRDLRVSSWNRCAELLWGLRDRDVRGRSFVGLDIGLPTGPLRGTIEECLASRRPAKPVRVKAIDRTGRSFPCVVTCSPLQGERGGVVVAMSDSGER